MCGSVRYGWPCLVTMLCWGLVATGYATPLSVVTTVAPLTDMVKQVGGEVIRLHGLVPAGVNAHTFQPTPQDVQHLAMADLVIFNGLFLEEPTEKLLRSSGQPGVTVLKLGERTIDQTEWVFDFSFPKEHGHPNPHLWLNVAYAMTYTRLIGEQLRALAPDHAARFQHNAQRYLARLERLDQCIAMAINTIPARQRTLLTYHDSWPYFARRYGMTVLGAVQPANFSEPSPREMRRIIDQIRRERVPAIFGSEVFPSKVLEKIATETGVRYVTTLRDDALPGHPGDAQHSYIGMMVENVRAMVEALGGMPDGFRSCATTLLRETE